MPLDIVTPIIEKDIPVFRVSARLLRENLLHPIGSHYVVGPDHSEIRSVSTELGCEFVNERDVAPVPLARIRAFYAGSPRDRSGWLYQQFLKLNADTFTRHGNFLILDADSAFVRPVRMETEDEWIIDVTNGYEAAYDDSIRHLLGISAPLPYSFVVHFMVFNGACLKALRSDIENRSGLPWTEAVLASVDRDNTLCFSEWNLYANFVLRRRGFPCKMGFWFNREGQLDPDAEVEPQIRALSDGAKTVSLHFYKRKKTKIGG